MLTGPDLTKRLLELCEQQGFARAGVCPVKPSAHADALRQWLSDGKHGEMGYLADRLDIRLDPTLEVPDARSFLIVADRYATRDDPPDEIEPGTGRIARYARGKDYHRVIKRRLHTLADSLRAELGASETSSNVVFRSFVDTAPFLEREHAVRAGLGWVGKHTLVIDPELGSYLLLGGILTNLELPPPETQRQVTDHCGTCTRCIDACPTDAITPYSVDATRCISYLTLEHRSEIDPALQSHMGSWIAGCDICQEVCPHNSSRPTTAVPVAEAYESDRAGIPLLEVLGWDEDARREAVRGSAIKRIKLGMFKRNAIIALANQARADGDVRRTIVERLTSIAADASEDAMVRETARERAAWLEDDLHAGRDL